MSSQESNIMPPPPGKHTHSEHRLILHAMMAASEITSLPVTKEKIESVRKMLDRMDELFDAAVEECKRREWSIFRSESS